MRSFRACRDALRLLGLSWDGLHCPVRALLKEASFLFLDEATSALDNASEKMIQQTIDRISAQTKGLGIVSIAHRLSTIRNSDMIYVLSRGQVVEQGTHESLMKENGVYHALVAAQESSNSSEEAEAEQETEQETEQPEAELPHWHTAAMLQAKFPNGPNGPNESETDRKEPEEKQDVEHMRQKKIAADYRVPMLRLLSYNKPEWPFFVPAVLGALIEGSAMPVCSVVLVRSMDAFNKLGTEAGARCQNSGNVSMSGL